MGNLSKEDFAILSNSIYIFASIISLLIALKIDFGIKKPNIKIQFIPTIFIIFLFVIVVGFRGYEVGSDTSSYYFYGWIMNLPSVFKSEVVFYWLIQIIKYLGGSFTVFLLIVALLFYLFIYKTFVNISLYNNASLFLIFFSFISLFFAQSLAINVIRQGVALSFIIYSYSMWLRSEKLTKILIFIVLGIACHTTVIIPVILFIFCLYLSRLCSIKYYVGLYVLGIILSAFNFGILNVSPFLENFLNNNKRLEYLQSQNSIYDVGFKPQFVVFNTIFLGVFYYILKKIIKNQVEISKQYNILLKYFILASFLFFMAFQIPYSDRWGLFSWITIPILMAPVFRLYKSKIKLRTSFVLFFIFIYIFFQFYGSTK